MTLVEVYSKRDCHLCDVAKDALTRIRERHPFELSVIMIEEGDARYEEFKERVPVIFVNKAFAFQYRVPETAFVHALQEAAR
jgi:glutaredoxin